MKEIETPQSEPQSATRTPPSTFPCNDVLREKLRAMRDAHGSKWSNSKLAARLGYNVSVVSQYLNDDGNKYPGDIATVERKVDDFLRNEARRRASGVETTDSEVAQDLFTALEFCRKTNGVAAIVAESGEGKTRALELYLKGNPTVILFHVRSWSRDLSSIEGAMLDAAGRAGWDNRTKRSLFLVQKLRDTDRLIIVDDAHKLTKPALQYLFDLHDETNCPLALVGTFALEQTLEEDPQRSSRVGISYPIKGHNVRPLITHMINQLVPDSNGEAKALCDMCEEVASQHGHFRNVHQQLKFAVELKEADKKLTWCAAFRQAGTFMPNRPHQ